VLTRETASPLAPGTYTIKFVIEDVSDRQVDSAIFIPADSLKLFALAQGDYNGDGCVNAADYTRWAKNLGASPASFYHGDGDGNCVVDSADYSIWVANFGNSGNRDFRADFNRDGIVDGTDTVIHQEYWGLLNHCASRFEGDADRDGDVDDDDFEILGTEFEVPNCGCNCDDAMRGGDDNSVALSREDLPQSADIDEDGDVDGDDLELLDEAILGAADSE
jgi:hypothetical protein